jgi:hypothetical protein
LCSAPVLAEHWTGAASACFSFRWRHPYKGQGKASPVTGCGGPQGCETSRLPHFLDNRLTDGGEIASHTRRPSFTPRNIPGTPFC